MIQELRAYHFQLMYLTSIHAGIQTQHCSVEMFLKYPRGHNGPRNKVAAEYLYRWAQSHKTTIVLNGGYQNALIDLFDFLDTEKNPYPWGCFHESEDALNGCLTNVGIIVPESVFSQNVGAIGLSEWERELRGRIASCRLMA